MQIKKYPASLIVTMIYSYNDMQLNKQEVFKLKNVAPVNCYAADGKFG